MLLRRMTQADLDDAPPEAMYIEAQNDAINKLVDQVSTPEKPQSIALLQQANVEVFDIDVQTPDPWYTVGIGAAPAYQNSYTGTSKYMKSYDGWVEVNVNISNGGAATAFTLPVGFTPESNVNVVVWDGFLGSATILMTIKPDGTVNFAGASTHTVLAYAAFLAKDVTPIPQSCFPVLLKTKLPSVEGVVVIDCSDNGNAGASQQAQSGSVGSVDFLTTTSRGQLQIKVKNIMGLPYNRKSHLKLLAIGGS